MSKISMEPVQSRFSSQLATSRIYSHTTEEVDVLLIGAGVMSATLATFLQELEPDWKLYMVERLPVVAGESSNGWNNAGTGHSALAELNYTPEQSDGSISITKALAINEAFIISRQFWSSLVNKGRLQSPRSFINSTPHMSFVWGEENVNFLRKRFNALQSSTLFRGMQFSDDPATIREWAPIIMQGRNPQQRVAATRSEYGTDVNFGEITRQLIDSLSRSASFRLKTSQEVKDFIRLPDGRWQVTINDLSMGKDLQVIAGKVFIGAGGAALPLLQKTGIPEAKCFAGFPVGGSFLVTENPQLVQNHLAKVYGKASVGAPPMSVPHVDTRVLDGKRVLLFGPFATFTTRFLKQGSLLDMFNSMTPSNLMPMLQVGAHNISLIKYLVGQVMQSDEDRLKALRQYVPEAKGEDWHLAIAGQRVQIIENDPQKGGTLRLGTEIVTSEDGSISALLGASPGASTAAQAMLDLLSRIFGEKIQSYRWQEVIKSLIPHWQKQLNGDVTTTEQVLQSTSQILQLDYTAPVLSTANAEFTSHSTVSENFSS